MPPDAVQLITAVPAERAVTVPSAVTEATLASELLKDTEDASAAFPSMEAVRTADASAFKESDVLFKVTSFKAVGCAQGAEGMLLYTGMENTNGLSREPASPYPFFTETASEDGAAIFCIY